MWVHLARMYDEKDPRSESGQQFVCIKKNRKQFACELQCNGGVFGSDVVLDVGMICVYLFHPDSGGRR